MAAAVAASLVVVVAAAVVHGAGSIVVVAAAAATAVAVVAADVELFHVDAVFRQPAVLPFYVDFLPPVVAAFAMRLAAVLHIDDVALHLVVPPLDVAPVRLPGVVGVPPLPFFDCIRRDDYFLPRDAVVPLRFPLEPTMTMTAVRDARQQ